MHKVKVNRDYSEICKKDKLLVLGAGPFQLHLIEKAREMGAYVIAITPEGPYPGIPVADKVYFHDAKIEEYVYSVAKKEQIEGIISDQGDIFVKPVAYVAEKMGLPGNSYETALIYTDKARMRKKGIELGLATIKNECVENVEEAETFFNRINSPAIIKPVDSASSKGVYKINTIDDLNSRFGEAMAYSRSGRVIIEQFIYGPQFEVDSIAAGGVIKPLMYADLDEFSIPNVFSSKTRLYPSVADERVIKKLLDYNQKINEGFGMIQGLSHNEYIMDKESEEIYLIEAALRGGGTYIASHIAELQTGLDTAEHLVNIALGRDSGIPIFETNRCHCGYVSFYLPVGKVICKDGLEEVENLKYVVKTTFERIKLNETTKPILDKNQRQAIVLFASSREQIKERIEAIKKKINVLVETSEGIKGPIWD